MTTSFAVGNSVSAAEWIRGDVNNDQVVDIRDATEIQSVLVKLNPPCENFDVIADFNNDGKVNIRDATEIQFYIAEIKEETEPSSSTETSETEMTEQTTETVTQPVSTEQTEPSETQQVSTEPISTEPSETESTTEVTEATETQPESTEPSSSEQTEPITTEPETTIPDTTQATEEIETTEVTETTEPTTEVVYPSYIKLSADEIKLGQGETFDLEVESDIEDYMFSFESSDSSVAIVTENGEITAVGIGTAVITCKTENGLEAVCNIQVCKMAQSIMLNKTELTLGVGEVFDLDSYAPSGCAAYHRDYYSDNSNVASVEIEGGLVTAKAVGTTYIRCKLVNGVEAVCRITVKPMASSITLNADSLTLGIGETFDLNSYIPDGTMAYYRNYYSDNSNIASVEIGGGLVTAKAVGTTKIRCRLTNGVEAVCNVTVKNAPTSAELSKSSVKLRVGENYTISEHTNSGSYSSQFTWSSSNNKVLTVEKISGTNKCKISPKMQGTATVTMTTYNGVKATCKVTVSGSIAKAIDISTWHEKVNFNKVKADGYDYVIIRAGYGDLTSQKDDMFEPHYKNAKAAGLKVGAYWYSYSDSVADSKKEAQACLNAIKGKKFDLPIYYDLEEDSMWNLSKSTVTNMADTFCSTIEKSGYKAGVYSYTSFFDDLLDKPALSKKYSTWLAKIDGDFSGITDDIHQFTFTGDVSGVPGNADCNYIYNLNILR